MKENYDPKYYTLDIIPDYRNEYIDIRIKWLTESYNLKRSSWPLDCIKLLDDMAQSDIIPFYYGFCEIPDKVDAKTEYVEEHDVYIMLLNINKLNYPPKYSGDMRIHFTICHEIGHIVLGHLLIPRVLKTKEELDIEEAEADEFAGRLLMPRKIVFGCNFYSIDKAALYFKVSKASLWKRLNNMKRLDLFQSRKVICCPKCGNTHFSPLAEFCGICGHKLDRNNLWGMVKVLYGKGAPVDRYKRVTVCPRCGGTVNSIKDTCSFCRLHLLNYCTSYFEGDTARDECSYANLGSSRFCEMCGKPTYFYKQNLLPNWQEELDDMGLF